MYLPSWVIHHSFGADVPEWTGCERAGEERRLVDKYGVGGD